MSHVDSYIKAFGVPGTSDGDYPKDSRLAKAYEVALDIRKFEIDLYWKRSSSFWLLVGGIAAALGFMLSGKSGLVLSTPILEMVCCFLSVVGCFVCAAWVRVNRSSKFWQRNWELQVQILEDQVVGPLYKSVFAERSTKVMHSLTRINEYIASCFIAMFGASAILFIVGSNGIACAKKFLVGHGWWPTGDWMTLVELSAKLVIAIAAFVLARRAFAGAMNDRGPMLGNDKKAWIPGLDMEVEVSVRTIRVVDKCSSEAADVHWRKADIKPDTAAMGQRSSMDVAHGRFKRSKASFFRRLLRR